MSTTEKGGAYFREDTVHFTIIFLSSCIVVVVHVVRSCQYCGYTVHIDAQRWSLRFSASIVTNLDVLCCGSFVLENTKLQLSGVKNYKNH